MNDEKLKVLIQWIEINIKNLEKERADNIYMESVKYGFIKMVN